jgi:hypothetical protein
MGLGTLELGIGKARIPFSGVPRLNFKSYNASFLGN